jgi:aryl-alcohol dehydrogenase-like predicted oxidoreductase
VQNQYSLLWREPERDGVLEACERLSTSFLPFYPLANGLLTGKVVPGQPVPEGTRLAAMPKERSSLWLSDEYLSRVSAIGEIADRSDLSMLSLAFSWLLSREPVASVIAGATNPDQVRANASAAVTLDDAVIRQLDELANS